MADCAHGTDNYARKPDQHRGRLPAVGASAPAFTLAGSDLAPVSSEQFHGKPVLLNIFPSVDTPVCATSVRTFNERAAAGGLSVLCVSNDLPFAQARFCGAEGIENVKTASGFRDSFGQDYGVTIADGPFAGLLARAVVVIGADGNVAYSELVPEIAQEPNYDAALAALSDRLSWRRGTRLFHYPRRYAIWLRLPADVSQIQPGQGQADEHHPYRRGCA